MSWGDECWIRISAAWAGSAGSGIWHSVSADFTTNHLLHASGYGCLGGALWRHLRHYARLSIRLRHQRTRQVCAVNARSNWHLSAFDYRNQRGCFAAGGLASMTPHGLHHRYYAHQVGTYGNSGQFPRGHLGQADYCLGPAGNVLPCGSPGVMATLPALPGGGLIPSGQNIQTPPPTATTPALLPTAVSSASTMIQMLPWLAGGLLVLAFMRTGQGRGRK